MSETNVNQTMIVAGLSELALGALTGWPYSVVVSDPEKAKKLGIRSGARMRQWHLDLIALGALTVMAGSAVPDLPRKVGLPLMIGAWTNANAFGVLVVKPDAVNHPLYKAGVGASFVTTTWGFCGLALVAARRAARQRREA